MSNDFFASVEAAPADEILGVTTRYLADKRPDKVNLGVGMYLNDQGVVETLEVVKAEEAALSEANIAHSYIPIRGLAGYRKASQEMVFGADSEIVRSGRAATVQALGGTGALKIGVDFLHLIVGSKIGAASTPTWGNHYGLITQAGCELVKYRYYDAINACVDFAGMIEDLKKLPSGAFVILHSCCHNPTGYDLSVDQWKVILDLCIKQGLIPFLDMAYQGFRDGLYEDAAAIRLFADSGMSFLVATSYSKSFGLYSERVGALTVVTQSKSQADRVITRLEKLIRANYSNPPAHGARIVENILSDSLKRARWEEELTAMRLRIKSMREGLVQRMIALGSKRDFSFVTRQAGMFSFTGFTPEQMVRLEQEFGIYAVRNGRICICGLNTHNLDYVAESFVKVQ